MDFYSALTQLQDVSVKKDMVTEMTLNVPVVS